MKKICLSLSMLIGLALLGSVQAQNATDLSYQRPPDVMARIIEAPATPSISIDSKGEWMLELSQPGYPSIEEVAQPELRIGGLRINPATNGQSRSTSFDGLNLIKISNKERFEIQGLPANARINYTSWSPDEKQIAFTHTTNSGIELWVIEVNTKQAKRLGNFLLNDAYFGSPFDWSSDSKSLIAKIIPSNRGEAPKAPLAPKGPTIQQNIGEQAPSRTYQDLLKNPYDEDLFTYYLSASLVQVNLDGQVRDLGISGTIRSFNPSPDGTYILVERMHKPYSYLVPAYNFPYKVEVMDMQGKLVKEIASIPLAEKIPIGFDAVIDAPRGHGWRPDQPASLYWISPLDGGNPRTKIAKRDELHVWAAPFNDKSQVIASSELRMRGTQWSERGFVIVYERWWQNRSERRWMFSTTKPGAGTLLIDRLYEDLYSDPGSAQSTKGKFGRSVLLTDKKGENIFMIAEGASPEGNRPFVSTFNLKTKKQNILWRSEAPYYERPVSILDENKGSFITRRESETEQPNYHLRNWKNKSTQAITDFPHPSPELIGIQKEFLTYTRKDGVTLTATLYLPKDYKKEDGTLPVFMWAYPREFKTAAAAGQVKTSPYEFTRINWGSPLYWVTQGYAVLDRTDFPIVGEGDNQPNDTYVEQLVANAEAAINVLVERGISDGKRIGVGGHSYGAFMTANLLVNSKLFAAGIARSGAYNRTLTPFGFQAEERTYWQAPDVYNAMSPFMAADKLKTPILLIHGEADNNSGTFPIQSERYYNALKGHGATTRLVFLPHESHGYRAKESVLHMLWEMHEWLEKYVKNANVSQ